MLAEEPRAIQAAKAKVPRWNINRSALYVLEQVFALEKFPSHHMRQRLAADLGVTARQVSNPLGSPPARCLACGGVGG